MRGDLADRENTLLPLRVDDRLHGDVDMTVRHGEGATLARPPVLGEAMATTGRPRLPPPLVDVVVVVVVVRRC